ncbi:MAG TPA: protein kinase [Byssovorax sp.]|jgi:hypothetical protein
MPASGGPYREREARPARRLGRYALLEQRDDSMIGARWIAALETARASGATRPALHVVEIAPAIAERARSARALDRGDSAFAGRDDSDSAAAGRDQLRDLVDVTDAALEAVHEVDLGDAALIASSLVAGERLSRVAADEPRVTALAGAALAAHVVAEAARGAGALHRAGLAHGAITPRRVIIGYDGAITLVGAVEAALLPFADAHAQHEARGEIAYRAPEVLGGARASATTDVLSLGVLAWELVARASPFRRATARATLEAASACAPPPLPASCPRAVARVVEAALARDPSARPRDGDDLANALRAAAGVDAKTGQRALAAHMRAWFDRERAALDARLTSLGLATPG